MDKNELKKRVCRERAKGWYYANREKALKRIKAYQKNPDWILKRKVYRRQWYLKNRNKILAQRKDPNYKKHCDVVRKAYRSRPEIKVKNRLIKRQWDLKNRALINKKRRVYCRKKYNSDVLYKLRLSMHNQLVKGLNYNSLTKRNRTFGMLGYSVEDLKKHLELQFTSEMSWDNYGSYWHIDHKIPKSFASNKTELINLFQLDNLQPLEAKLNISKHNRVIADLFGSGSWNK